MASEDSDGFGQRLAPSGSQHSVVNAVTTCLSPDVWSSTRKVVRGNDSVPSVEESALRGQRDRDLDSAQTLSGRQNILITWNGILNVLFEEKMQLNTEYLKLKPTWK